MLSKTKKTNIIKKLGKTDGDTGSPEVQVGILTKRIDELSKHLKINKKDVHSRKGLIQMISNRRKHLKYLSTKSPKRYTAMVKELGL
jgi:small subunit ribosomal protein S15